MKKLACITIFLIIIFTQVSCAKQAPASVEVTESIKPVKVTEVNEQARPVTLEYIGTVTANKTKKIGFKTSGKIKKVYVEKGQYIKKGDPLAALDTKDIEYGVQAAKAQLEAAKAQYEKAINGASNEDINNAALNIKKAEDAYQFSLDNYEKYQKLYEDGGIPKQTLDQAKLDMDIKRTSLDQAKEIYKQLIDGTRAEDKKALEANVEAARSDYEYKKNMLEDGLLYSDIEGYVVEVLQKEGEIISAGYPVVVVRNDSKVVNIGLTQKDISKIEIGDQVMVEAEGETVDGFISNIAEIPDSNTRTYNIEIILNKDAFKIGWIVKVSILNGEEKGIWIPITTIQSNGEDYVFINENGMAKKKKITIEEINNFEAKVSGVEKNTQLIIEGMKRLVDGDKISIQE